MMDPDFSPFPLLTTNRLTLRQISNEDATELFWLRSSPTVMQYIGRPLAVSIDDVWKLIDIIESARAKNDGITWAITTNESPKLIGTIGYWKLEKENYRAEIGYLLHPAFYRKGIMHEAFQAVIPYGFNSIKLHSIEANVNPENTASIKLLERNDFIREAYFKENCFWNGKFCDSAIYSLINK